MLIRFIAIRMMGSFSCGALSAIISVRATSAVVRYPLLSSGLVQQLILLHKPKEQRRGDPLVPIDEADGS
ncbi:MAG: hypothetical protein MZV65_42280 [Chromatiales bacterium]|nr:hypothetical protein [Chromatiales bacterium]